MPLLDFFSWVYLKRFVYEAPVQSEEDHIGVIVESSVRRIVEFPDIFERDGNHRTGVSMQMGGISNSYCRYQTQIQTLFSLFIMIMFSISLSTHFPPIRLKFQVLVIL